MNIANRILVIGLSSSLMFIIFELVRRKMLKEKYAIIWLFSGMIILSFAIFNNILERLAMLLGIMLPVNAVFFFGIFFIILINLHFSLVISNLSEQNKRIAQRISLLESKIESTNKE